MEPFTDDERVQEDETSAAASPDSGVVTGPAPYEVADDDDVDED